MYVPLVITPRLRGLSPTKDDTCIAELAYIPFVAMKKRKAFTGYCIQSYSLKQVANLQTMRFHLLYLAVLA